MIPGEFPTDAGIMGCDIRGQDVKGCRRRKYMYRLDRVGAVKTRQRQLFFLKLASCFYYFFKKKILFTSL